jgi:hypothetical protein
MGTLENLPEQEHEGEPRQTKVASNEPLCRPWLEGVETDKDGG